MDVDGQVEIFVHLHRENKDYSMSGQPEVEDCTHHPIWAGDGYYLYSIARWYTNTTCGQPEGSPPDNIGNYCDSWTEEEFYTYMDGCNIGSYGNSFCWYFREKVGGC